MDSNDKKFIISFVSILLIVLFFCLKKQGLFTDEIYTYGLANSYFAPYIADIYGGNLIDKIVINTDLFKYVTVASNERFCFDSVFYNQAHDTLPPLYYCIIHFICSLFPETFSKWYGLGINVLLYAACLIMLFKLSNKIFNDSRSSLLAVIFYGLSTIGMSTMLMIRMYILLTFLTILLAYFSIQLIENQKVKNCMLISLLLYLGMMTHYYYSIYAFFLFLSSVYYLIKKRHYKFIAVYTLFNVFGILMFFISFPAFFNQLFAPKLVSAHTAFSNISMLSSYKNVITYFSIYIYQTLPMHIFAGLIALLCLLKRVRILLTDQVRCYYNIIAIPAILAVFLVSVISPIVAERYIYNLVPILCLLIAREIKIVCQVDSALSRLRYNTILMIIFMNTIFLFHNPPSYLYPQMPKVNQILKLYSDNPCVFFDNNFSSPLTENLFQLILFNNFIVVNDVNSKHMKAYIREHKQNENVVLYVDTNQFFSSGYNSEDILDNVKRTSEYKNHKYLYSNYSVDVYVLSK